ncbi:MAG: SDR family oxidoreductase [Phenylobacterium sp.]|uniref:SDR family NAD(P)-dependent oxidoreductase n=1 Tax=Phenylobacterium sp. TaxID=1871053 RepID=UPI0011FB7EEE|nr:SDR family oxidoreductase [Phenylobacterium sp.]TAJ72773.1 MAG: SDR family oxidoreductase [Phenylobacterium sp.]
MGRMAGKVALVTGAAGGIGRACALTLAREGARVFAADVDLDGLAETCALAEAAGPLEKVPLDVTSEADWVAVMAQVERDAGALHALVNNAGLCISAPLLETTNEIWRRQQSVNLDGVFFGTRAAMPLLARAGGASIVNVSSVAGLTGVPGLSAYCATKGGVRLFSKAVALECAAARNGVRVNSVHPGAIETAIWVKMQNDGRLGPRSNSAEELMDGARKASVAATPMGFPGAPEDIAEGVLYLCTDAARFVTGAELVIDGGVHAA